MKKINLYYKGLKENVAKQKAMLEKAIADWDKIFDDEKVKDGDFSLAITDEELGLMVPYVAEAIISYIRYEKTEPNPLGLFDSTIWDYKRKEIDGPLTDEEQVLYDKIKEIEDDYQKNGVESSIFITYQSCDKDYSIIRKNLKGNFRILLSFYNEETPDEEDTGTSSKFDVVAESDSELTIYDILVALGVPEFASNFLEFKEIIKEKFAEKIDED